MHMHNINGNTSSCHRQISTMWSTHRLVHIVWRTRTEYLANISGTSELGESPAIRIKVNMFRVDQTLGEVHNHVCDYKEGGNLYVQHDKVGGGWKYVVEYVRQLLLREL